MALIFRGHAGILIAGIAEIKHIRAALCVREFLAQKAARLWVGRGHQRLGLHQLARRKIGHAALAAAVGRVAQGHFEALGNALGKLGGRGGRMGARGDDDKHLARLAEQVQRHVLHAVHLLCHLLEHGHVRLKRAHNQLFFHIFIHSSVLQTRI